MTSSSYPDMIIPYTDGVNFGCYICPAPPRDHYEEHAQRMRTKEAKKVTAKERKDPKSLASTTPISPFLNPFKGKKESPQETGLKQLESSTHKFSSKTLEKRPSKAKASVGRLVSCFSNPRVEGEEAEM